MNLIPKVVLEFIWNTANELIDAQQPDVEVDTLIENLRDRIHESFMGDDVTDEEEVAMDMCCDGAIHCQLYNGDREKWHRLFVLDFIEN